MISEITDMNCNIYVLLFLFFQTTLLVVLSLIDKNRLKYTYGVLFSNEYFYKYDPKNYKLSSSFTIFSQVLYLLNIAFFVSLFFKGSYNCKTLLYFYRDQFLFFSVVQLLKMFVVSFSKRGERESTFLQRIFCVEYNYMLSISLVVMPVALIVLFQSIDFQWLSNVLIWMLLAIYMYKLFLMFVYNKILIASANVNIILYLCTFEILPIIFWYKMLIE